MDAMLAEYLPILIFIGIAVGLAVVIVAASYVIARQRPDSEKVSAYECGFEAFDDARSQFDVRFRSEEHTSELQSLMRISYDVFCLNKKKKQPNTHSNPSQQSHT